MWMRGVVGAAPYGHCFGAAEGDTRKGRPYGWWRMRGVPCGRPKNRRRGVNKGMAAASGHPTGGEEDSAGQGDREQSLLSL